MLGWCIIVSTQTPQERDRDTTGGRNSAILARWEVGLGGVDWLEELVKAGGARRLARDGYPSRYTARARDVLPLLADDAPLRVGLLANARCLELHPDRMAACPEDTVLTIDAWDLS